MKTLIITLGLVLTGISNVEAVNQDDLLHGTAHFGGTYSITHVTEVVCRKLVGKEHKLSCSIAGVVVSNALNVAYKARQGFPADSKRSIASGAAGSVAAFTVIQLDF